MFKRVLYIVILLSSLLLSSVLAQETDELTTFQPGESFITFDYPSTWLAREQGRVIALASDESALPLDLNQSLASGQFKILLVYLTADQRAQANIDGTTPDSILQSVINNSNILLSNDEFRRYEFERRLTVRADFANDNNAGAAWVMQMDDNAIVLLQIVTATDEMHQLEGQIIELLRSLNLSTVARHLYAISDLERPLRFTPQQTRLVFTYPDGWDVREENATTIVLVNQDRQTQISLQFFDYTDLSRQGIPIDDPTAVLLTQHQRSNRPDTFGVPQQVVVNGEMLPYSTIQGDRFAGLSLGRDIKVGFLWVTVLTAGDIVPDDISTLTWALLLTSTFRPDPVDLTKRLVMPQHSFEFFYPDDWLARELTPSSFLLGTSDTMIDQTPESLLFADNAQLLIQYVTEREYGLARAGTDSPLEVLQKFITSASDFTTYDRPRRITLGGFEFAQVDFDNPNYSGTALLAPMADGGAVWMQLRTPPAELGDWEPIALAIARSSRIVDTAINTGNILDEAIFEALGIQPTPIPAPTRAPGAPPALGDVIGDVLATPMPRVIRELNFSLPTLASSYTTNFSQMTTDYPAGWLLQETLPVGDISPTHENSLRLSNNANLILNDQLDIREGDAQIVVQYTRYADMNAIGFRGDNLFELITSIVTAFPKGTFETPLQFRINGDLMVLVPTESETRRGVSIHSELSSEGYVTVQLFVNPNELNLWLPTAIAVAQSVGVE